MDFVCSRRLIIFRLFGFVGRDVGAALAQSEIILYGVL